MRLIDAEKLYCDVKEHCKKLIDKGAKDVDVVDIAAQIGALLQDAQTVDTVPGRWISVKDELPPDQEEVLVCTLSKNGVRNIDKGSGLLTILSIAGDLRSPTGCLSPSCRRK